MLGAPAAAKLVRPPLELAAPKPPLKAENPDPRDAKPPEGLAAAAKPVAAGFSVSAGVDSVEDLKTDGVDAPRDPNGDCSEPAKADRLDEAKAEEDVAGLASSAGGFDVEVPIAPNGDTEDVFANALGRDAYKRVSCFRTIAAVDQICDLPGRVLGKYPCAASSRVPLQLRP